MFFKGLGEVYSSDKQKDRQSEEGKKIFMGIFIHYRQGVDRPISICLIKFGKKGPLTTCLVGYLSLYAT